MSQGSIVHIGVIIVVIFAIFLYNCESRKEGFIRINPIFYNYLDRNRFIRIGVIQSNIKMDKFGRIESNNFIKPRKEVGNKNCRLQKCPSWLRGAKCWKCK